LECLDTKLRIFVLMANVGIKLCAMLIFFG
jgi:hypothetical protein